jgi:hypothetical protein
MATSIERIEKLLNDLFQPGDLVEIKGLGGPNERKMCGLFNDFHVAAKAAYSMDIEYLCNVYFCSNPIDANFDHAKLMVVNKPMLKAWHMAGNEDTPNRAYYMLDIDPVRDSGVAATDEEVAAASHVKDRVLNELTDAGFPSPLVIFSGNGYHMLLKGERLKVDGSVYHFVLGHLSDVCGSALAHVDIAVSNLARGVRCPFTTNRKGKSTASRPHREAFIVAQPDPMLTVSNEQMLNYAKKNGYGSKFRGNRALIATGAWELTAEEDEVAEFIEEYLSLSHVTHNGDAVHFALSECPFGGIHTDQVKGRGKTNIILTSDKLIFKCFAGACEGYWWKSLWDKLTEENGKAPDYKFWTKVEDEDEEEEQSSPLMDVCSFAEPRVPNFESLTCENMRDEFFERVLFEDGLIDSPAKQELFRAEANRISVEDDAQEMARWIGQQEVNSLLAWKRHGLTGDEFRTITLGGKLKKPKGYGL